MPYKLEHQLCFEVYKAANQFTKLYAKILKTFDLTYPQYLVLLALWEKDAQTSSTICEKLNLGIGTLNPVLQKLLEKGWILKQPSPTDKRATMLFLTKKAQQQKQHIEQAILEKLLCFDYLATEGPSLKEKLQRLNEFLLLLNSEESL
ncbi:MarR family winged helix-turn-helix transcriptional regulator [Lysinibacillus sp. 54212]|uniref:MarR family winged helix-turn-helix transcriptional regulator n=1 Tax=Lysinibacillus sp. 54212 TaxID=3119829 RepID=UPI002FCB34B0